jgi:hypothetical protein
VAAGLAHGAGELFDFSTWADLKITCQTDAKLAISPGRARTLALAEMQPGKGRQDL